MKSEGRAGVGLQGLQQVLVISVFYSVVCAGFVRLFVRAQALGFDNKRAVGSPLVWSANYAYIPSRITPSLAASGRDKVMPSGCSSRAERSLSMGVTSASILVTMEPFASSRVTLPSRSIRPYSWPVLDPLIFSSLVVCIASAISVLGGIVNNFEGAMIKTALVSGKR